METERTLWYRDGNATLTNGSFDVVGLGTLWLTQARSGDMFAVTDSGGAASVWYEIMKVADNTHLKLRTPYGGETVNISTYAIVRNFSGKWSMTSEVAADLASHIRDFQLALQRNMRGDEGPPGADGKSVLSGQGAPSAASGTEGDWYLEMTTWAMYRKEAGSWMLRGELRGSKGDPGKDGVQWHYDETPAASVGNAGDINFNGVTGDVHRRTATGWTLIGNFRGPEGKQGIQGKLGPKGDPAKWHSGSGVPAGSTGTNNDMYLNVANGDTYKKTSDIWALVGNIKGRVGDPGPTGPTGMTFRGVWDIATPYEHRDAIQHGGNAWIAKAPNVGVSPPATQATLENEAWSLFVARGVDGTGVGDMQSALYDPEKTGKVLSAKSADSAATAGSASSVTWDGVKDVPAATTDAPGIVRLASPEEMQTGESETVAVTPAGVKAAIETIEIPELPPQEIVDALDSDRVDAALAAAQGKKLKAADAALTEALNEKAEVEHQHEIADVDGLADLADKKADLVEGKVPLSQLPDFGGTNFDFADWRAKPNPQVGAGWPAFQNTWKKMIKHVRDSALIATGGLLDIKQSIPSGVFPGLNGFAGGVLFLNGRVFCVPFNSTTARIYDPVTNTTTIPAGTYPGNGAFIGGIPLPGGQVFCVPFNSTTARIYDPVTNTTTIPSGIYPGTGAFLGGVPLPDGRAFCAPCNSTTARIYDPVTDTITTPAGTYSSGAFYGCVPLPDGRVFVVPFNSTTARIYDPVTDTITTPAGTYPGNGAFIGGTLLPDGRIFCTPYNSTTARIYDPVTDTTTIPSGTYPGSGGLVGSIPLPDGRIFCVPHNSGTARIYDPATDTTTTTLEIFPTNIGFYGGVPLPDGGVFCVPSNSVSAKIIFTSRLDVPINYATSPFINKF